MQILQLLADGKIHSGEGLGRALGITRAAVWKQVEMLRKKGVDIEVMRGQGYRLPRALEQWNSTILLEGLSLELRPLLAHLQVEESVSSTNDVVAAFMRQHPRGAVVCLAEEQTAGRGRRGRDWFSPWGRSIYCSMGWTFPEGLVALEGLSLAVGVAIARALRRYGVEEIRLKWPNDLMVRGAKLGGVLIEVQAEAGGACQAIIGVGLNLALPADSSVLLGRPVTDISTVTGGVVRKNELGAAMLDELLGLLQCYSVKRFAGIRDEWMSLDALRGQQV